MYTKRILPFYQCILVCGYHHCTSLDCRFMVDHPYSLPLFQGSLNVNEAADPSSRACYLSRFLFSSDIMYEIIVFGLNDSNPKVSDWPCSGIANIICG